MRADPNSSLADNPQDLPEDETAPLREKWSSSFRKAEDLLKRVERQSDALGTGILNELRYSAEHVRRAIAGWSKEDPAEELRPAEEWQKAIDHCRRAHFDAAEIIVIDLMEEMARFFDDFDEHAISLKLDKVTAAREAFFDAQKRLRSAYVRPQQRAERADEMLAVADALELQVDQLRLLRPHYYAEVARRGRRARTQWMMVVATGFFTVIAAIIGAVVSSLL